MTSFKFLSYELHDNNEVLIVTNRGSYLGRIEDAFPKNYFLYLYDASNDYLFRQFGIDKIEFSKRVLGYRPNSGGWPEMKSKEDILKVLDKLLIYSKIHDEY